MDACIKKYIKVNLILLALVFLALAGLNNCGGGGGGNSNDDNNDDDFFDGDDGGAGACDDFLGIDCEEEEDPAANCPSGDRKDCDGDGIPATFLDATRTSHPCDQDDTDVRNKRMTEDCDPDQDGFINPVAGLGSCANLDSNHDGSFSNEELAAHRAGRNACDNCPLEPNPEQGTPGNPDYRAMVGSACGGDQAGNDRDRDIIADGSDNCPDEVNFDQTDMDGDGAGDICDRNPDDGVKYVTGGECNTLEGGQDEAELDGSFRKPYNSLKKALDRTSRDRSIRVINVLEGYSCENEKITVSRVIKIQGIKCVGHNCSERINLREINEVGEELDRVPLPRVMLTVPSGSVLTVTADATIKALHLEATQLVEDENATVLIVDSNPHFVSNRVVASSNSLRGPDPRDQNRNDGFIPTTLPVVGIALTSQQRAGEIETVIENNKIDIPDSENDISRKIGVQIRCLERGATVKPLLKGNFINVTSAKYESHGISIESCQAPENQNASLYRNINRPQIVSNKIYVQSSPTNGFNTESSVGIRSVALPSSANDENYWRKKIGVVVSKNIINIDGPAQFNRNDDLMHRFIGVKIDAGSDNVVIDTNLITVGLNGVPQLPRCVLVAANKVDLLANTLVKGDVDSVSPIASQEPCVWLITGNRDQTPNRVQSNLFVSTNNHEPSYALFPGRVFTESNNIFDTNFAQSIKDVNGNVANINRTSKRLDQLDELLDEDFKPDGGNRFNNGLSFAVNEGPQNDITGRQRGHRPDVGCYQVSHPLNADGTEMLEDFVVILGYADNAWHAWQNWGD